MSNEKSLVSIEFEGFYFFEIRFCALILTFVH